MRFHHSQYIACYLSLSIIFPFYPYLPSPSQWSYIRSWKRRNCPFPFIFECVLLFNSYSSLKREFCLFSGSFSVATNKQSNRQCASYHFKCSDLECIPSVWKCDGERDCQDGSDEVGCSKSIFA